MAEEGLPVQLYVYDLSGGMARQWAPLLLGRPLEGIWHTAIVYQGREIYYGGGINVAPAGATPFGQPVQVLELGRTFLPEEVVDEFLAELSQRYTPQAYRLLQNNCNNFSDELATLLVGQGIPSHITGLPTEVMATPFGQMLRPLLAGLEQQLGSMRSQAYQPPPAAAEAATEAAAQAAGPEAAPEATAAAGAAPAPEAAAPAALSRLADGAVSEGAPALAAAEVEIEAAIAGGMVQDVEQQMQQLAARATDGAAAGAQPQAEPVPGPSSSAAAAVPATAGAPAAAAGGGGGKESEAARLAAELKVKAAFDRLMAGGQLSEHDALAAALEEISPAQPPQAATAEAQGQLQQSDSEH